MEPGPVPPDPGHPPGGTRQFGVSAAGRGLLTRVIESYSASEDGADRMQALAALENLADALARDGEMTAARSAYREVLDLVASEPDGSIRHIAHVEISLAELLIAEGDLSSLDEAELLLDTAEEQVALSAFFRNLVLRYLVARIRTAALCGEASRAAVYAREALSVADETEPSLPRHPDLGRPHASEAPPNRTTADRRGVTSRRVERSLTGLALAHRHGPDCPPE